MKKYDRTVTTEELCVYPNEIELAVMSRLLGTMLRAHIPILECISITIEMTPSAHLRQILNGVYGIVRRDRPVGEFLELYDDILNERFITAVKEGESENRLGHALSQYADDANLPSGYILKAISEHDGLPQFTKDMAMYLHEGNPLLQALNRCAQTGAEDLRKEIERLHNDVEQGWTLHEAMAKSPTETFCRLYYNMVKAGEMHQTLWLSFDLLVAL